MLKCQNCGHDNPDKGLPCLACDAAMPDPATTTLVRIHPTAAAVHVFRQARQENDDCLLAQLRGLVAYYGIYNLDAIEFDGLYLGRATLAHLLDIELADPKLLA